MASGNKNSVRLTTALSWKQLVDPDDVWLIIEYNTDGYVLRVKCRTCEKYQKKLRASGNFNESYAIGVTGKFSKAKLVAHEGTGQHAHGILLDKCENSGKTLQNVVKIKEPAATLSTPPCPGEEMESAVDPGAGTSNAVLVTRTVETVKSTENVKRNRDVRLIEIAYNMAKEEIPFQSFPALIEMELCRGLEFGDTCHEAGSCQIFVDCIGKFLHEQFVELIKQVKFFTILFDVFSNVSSKDVTGLLYILFVDPNSGELSTYYLKHVVLPPVVEKDEFKSFLESVFEEYSIEDYQSRLIGVGTNGDRAFSVDVGLGETEGETPILPWLVVSTTFSHRVEMAIKQSLTGCGMYVDVIMSTFADLFACLRNVKCLSAEMTELKGVLQEVHLDALEGVKWVQNMLKACKLVCQYYKHLMIWLESIAGSDQKPSCIISTLKNFRFVTTVMFLTQLLDPLARLCSDLQRSVGSFARVLSSVNHTILESIENLMCNCLLPGSDLQILISSISGNKYDTQSSPKCQYMGVELLEVNHGVENLFYNLVRRVESCLRPQLYTDPEKILKCAQVLETTLWPMKVVEMHGFGCGLLHKATTHFSELLHLKTEEITREWNMFKMFTKHCLLPSKPEEVWSSLCVDFKDDYPKLSVLMEVLLLFPHSPEVLARCYLTFKRAKSDWRSVLSDETLDTLLRIKFNGPQYLSFDAHAVFDRFFSMFSQTAVTATFGPDVKCEPNTLDVGEVQVKLENDEETDDAHIIRPVFHAERIDDENPIVKKIKLECDSD